MYIYVENIWTLGAEFVGMRNEIVTLLKSICIYDRLGPLPLNILMRISLYKLGPVLLIPLAIKRDRIFAAASVHMSNNIGPLLNRADLFWH